MTSPCLLFMPMQPYACTRWERNAKHTSIVKKHTTWHPKRWAKALEYAPYADTWHEIGMCSMEIGQLSYAKLAFEHVKEMEPDFEGINERLTSLYMLLKDKENFMKYNQLCEHPFRLEELDRLQQILQEDNQEELALVMKNIFNALQ